MGPDTQDRNKNMDQKTIDSQFARLSKAFETSLLPYARADKKGGLRRGYADEFMLMHTNEGLLGGIQTHFKHRGTRNYLSINSDDSVYIPVVDEDFLRGDFGPSPYDSRESALDRINALDRTTSGMSADDPSYRALCSMLIELHESSVAWLYPGSLQLQTHSGRRDRCPECGGFVDTWDQRYVSVGEDLLWGDVLEAHAPQAGEDS